MFSFLKRGSKRLTLVAGLAVLMLGLTVIAGWFSHQTFLIQVLPNLAPMQFNTALCFTLLGLALSTYYQRRVYLPFSFAVGVLFLSSATLIQYLTRIDIGIDEIFFEHYITVLTPNPGRMAPQTALSFLLLSIALLLAMGKFTRVLQQWIPVMLTSIVFALATISLFGYSTGLIPRFDWGSGTTMALHTSMGFLILAATIIFDEWSEIETYKEFRETVLATAIPITLVLSIFIFIALIDERRSAHKKILEANAGILRLAINQKIIGMTNNIVRMSLLWAQIETDKELQWRRYATLLHQDFDVFHSIAWVDASMEIRWAVPEITANEQIGLNMGDNPIARIFFLEARAKGTRFSELINIETTGPSVMLINPVFSNGSFDGWMLAQLDMGLLLESFRPLMDELGIAAQLQQRSGAILTRSDVINEKYSAGKLLHVPGQSWQLTVSPLPVFFETHATPLTLVATIMMFFGIFFALILINFLLKGRQNTHELEKIHNKLQSAFNAMIDGIVMISDSGIIEDANSTAGHIFGCQRKALIGAHMSQLIPNLDALSGNQSGIQSGSDFLTDYLSFRDEATSGHSRILRAVRKDGALFPIELKISATQSDGKQFFTGVIRDLSEKIATEEKLAERDSLINAAVKSSPVSVGVADLHGKFVDVNDAFCLWLGYSREELIGLSYLNILPNEERDAAQQRYQSLLLNSAANIRREKVYRRKDGELVWGLMNASPVTNAKGEVTHVAAQILDIGEERKLKQALRNQNKELAAINVELDQFAYIASHDLKEPLRTLRTFSSYLIKDVEKKDQSRIKEDVQFIDDAASRMSHLIDDLLRLSRAGNQAIARAPVALNQCIDDALTQLQALIKEKQAIIEVKDLPNISGDSTQLTSLFLNLINNGIKFHRDGVIPRLVIKPVTTDSLKEIAISVADNGIGIEESHLEDIFGAFNKLHNPSQYAGTGIGLAIVKKIIERHGGRVEVTSIINEGSQFTLYFPVPK